jgi:hypothetical protein
MPSRGASRLLGMFVIYGHATHRGNVTQIVVFKPQ